MLIYVSGPYTADTREGIDENIEAAAKIAMLWALQGHSVICPHTNTGGLEHLLPEFGHADWMRMDLEQVRRCDAVVTVPGWERSKGANQEIEYAKELGIPVYDGTVALPLHQTERTSPLQCKAFAETVGLMYRTHLDKNADYSPANIMGTGEIGVITRLWDKMARLMSLYGFNLRISEPAVYTKPREAKNESVDDTFVDLANYSIITRLLRKGVWGK